MSTYDRLMSLRPAIVVAAQKILDEWQPDEDGYDEEYGEGGACGDINREIQGIIADHLPGAVIEDGGHDGDDHAYTVVRQGGNVFEVDIPPGVYEEGAGYHWEKIPGVKLDVSDVVVHQIGGKKVRRHPKADY